jgi:cell division control protein 6
VLFRAGELAEQKGSPKVTDDDVRRAKKKVEEEIVSSMVATLPKHQQILLYSLADLSLNKKPQAKITGNAPPENVLFSGEVYEEYSNAAKRLKESPVSSRWYREYISELEMFGLISTTASGQGFRGNSRIIKLGFEPKKIRDQLDKELTG